MSSEVAHILIVDSRGALRRIVRNELAPLGATIAEACNGLEALESVRHSKPDLIIVDLEMPKLDGFGVCRALSASSDTLEIPVIVLSSREDEASRLEALDAGALEYFIKPFGPGELLQVAQRFFETLQRNRRRIVYSLDGDESTRALLNQQLRTHGYHYQGFASPKELRKQLLIRPCDLLLLDFQLPRHGTYAVLDMLKTIPNSENTAILALSSPREGRDLVRTFYSGARDLMIKPFTPNELLVRVEHLLYQLHQETELRQLATIDPLTRICNRGELMRLADIEVHRASRDERDLGIIMFDIDHFKVVNDTYGHPFGDEVLKAVADRVQKVIRPMDIVGRYGGEEFVVLLPCATRTGTAVVAERLRKGVEALDFARPEGNVKVRVSVGGITWKFSSLKPPPDFSSLLEPSDQALYVAKESGRNCCVTDPITSKRPLSRQ